MTHPFFVDIDPIAFHIGSFGVRWYGLMYLGGFIGGLLLGEYRRKRGRLPVDRDAFLDLAFYVMLGIIVGGRIWYMLTYQPINWIWTDPLQLFRVWDGGMSFHGGLIGTVLGIFYLAWKEKLPALRIHDYVACVAPIGLFFGRLANFVNHELWGAPTNVPWAVRFPEVIGGITVLGPPRHPSQFYEAILEGAVLFAILSWMFWRTEARYQPGKLVGAFGLFYGIFRFLVEFVREPDPQLSAFTQATGLHMGQWLSMPLILGGAWLMWTAKGRRVRVEPTLGSASIS